MELAAVEDAPARRRGGEGLAGHHVGGREGIKIGLIVLDDIEQGLAGAAEMPALLADQPLQVERCPPIIRKEDIARPHRDLRRLRLPGQDLDGRGIDAQMARPAVHDMAGRHRPDFVQDNPQIRACPLADLQEDIEAGDKAAKGLLRRDAGNDQGQPGLGAALRHHPVVMQDDLLQRRDRQLVLEGQQGAQDKSRQDPLHSFSKPHSEFLCTRPGAGLLGYDVAAVLPTPAYQ